MGEKQSNNSSNRKTRIAFGLYGAGGFAREVMPIVTSSIAITTHADTKTTYQIFFVETDPQEADVNGYPLISEKQFFELECAEHFFNIAISDSKIRARIANDCLAKGGKPMSIQSPHSIIYDHNEIGEGAIICANSIITSNAKIGKFFHSNIYSYVAHDCVIGDYVTFAPNVHCNGNVHIHNHAYIGTDAVIKQGSQSKPLIIGEGAVVGMGAVVTKDVPPFTIVVGNPAKPLNKT
ncbi:MAG: acetyltransferase [Pseudomonadota bacterium]|nr:acetyltransferase [Pseudomonadota bacterium]